jgi:hypothetical protein
VTLGEETLPECQEKALGERLLPRVLAHGTRGRGHLPRVLEHGTRGRHFSFFWQTVPSKGTVKCEVPFVSARRLSSSVTLPRVPWVLRHSGKPLIPECISSPSATLVEDWLPRVPDFWHSGKSLALGEFRFSRSERRCLQWFVFNTLPKITVGPA